nr:MAG TPA: hypothetical protein [Caudoviricetes sp.]
MLIRSGGLRTPTQAAAGGNRLFPAVSEWR